MGHHSDDVATKKDNQAVVLFLLGVRGERCGVLRTGLIRRVGKIGTAERAEKAERIEIIF